MKNLKKVKIGLIAALAASAVGFGAFAVTRLAVAPSPLSEEISSEISVDKDLNLGSAAATETPIRDYTMTSASVFAEAVTFSLNNGGALVEVKVGSDMTLTSKLTVSSGAHIRLDLNNHTITGSNVADGMINVSGTTATRNTTILELCDSSSAKGGKLTGNSPSSTYTGGGIQVAYSTFIMNGGEISGNSARYYGGGVYLQYSTFIMNGGKICNNTANDTSDSSGGGVYCSADCSFEMQGGEISGNSASSLGGGVYIGSSNTFTMAGGTISGNINTDSKGGGVYVSGTFNMQGGEISGNSSYGYGGGVYSENSTFTMVGGNIYNNTSTNSSGGGVYATGGTFTMNGGTISENTCASFGGGVYVSGTFNMQGGEISGNNTTSSNGKGGGVYVTDTGTRFEMSGGEITENTAVYGNGVYVGGGSFLLIDGLISNTKWGDSASMGGGVYLYGGTFSMRGGKIIKNAVGSVGGGVYAAGGTFTMNGGEISGNTSRGSGGGAYIESNATMNLRGGIITGNSANAYNVYLEGEGVINIIGKLDSKTYIGIDILNHEAGDVFTSGYSAKGNRASDAAKYFYISNTRSDSNPINEVVMSGNEVAIASTTITRTALSWTYSTAGVSTAISDPLGVNEVTYTGRTFSLSAGGAALTITNANGKIVSSVQDAGTYVAKAKEPQLYTNPICKFTVTPADLSSADVTCTDSTYTGKAITPTVKVKINGRTLQKDVDYTLEVSDNINAGTGSVTITGQGNYVGSASATFTIEKAQIGLRWGNTTVEYSGREQSALVLVEGLLGDDEVTVTVTYALKSGGGAISPISAGEYIATATVTGNDNYVVRQSSATHDFTIAKKQVNAIWSKTSFAFGETVNLTAYINDPRGRRVTLVVTLDSANQTASAAFASTYAEKDNFVLLNTETSYTVEKAEATLQWNEIPAEDLFFDGTAKKPTANLYDPRGNLITDGTVSYEYYSDGVKIDEPTAAGAYTAKIIFSHNNYFYNGSAEKIFVIKKAEIEVQLDKNFDSEYSGEGKSPVTGVATPNGETYVVYYAPVDAQGAVVGDYTSVLPVNAGRYTYYVDIDEQLKLNYAVKTAANPVFEIKPMSVTATWGENEGCHLTGGRYTWLYDGKVHAPEVKFVDKSGDEVLKGRDGETVVKVSGASSLLGYFTVSVSLESDNYVLSGVTTADCNILKSKVVSVSWYSYGSDQPLSAGEVPNYVNLSVYGNDGPKLSAYGLLAAAEGNWNNSDNIAIQLKVAYDVSYNGYWPARDNAYTARADLYDVDKVSDRCTLVGVDTATLLRNFKVITLAEETGAVDVEWVVVGQDGSHTPAKDYNFIYNGEEQRPVAIVILSESYNAANPQEGTYVILDNVRGGATNAGEHYAYIVPDGEYMIADEDIGIDFVISPKAIDVNWNVAPEYIYNGELQAPEAEAVDTGYLPCTVTVKGFKNAGEWIAVADAGVNFVINNPEQAFTIKKAEISVEWQPGDGAWNDDNTQIIFNHDGAQHAPEATATFNGVNVSLIVSGSAAEAGNYYAYATLDGSDYENLNFVLNADSAKIRFAVTSQSVQIIWCVTDENNNILQTFTDGDEIVFEYDGTEKRLSAYYENDGVKTFLSVDGEGTVAGDYFAYVSDDINAQNGKIRSFAIAPRALTLNWQTEGYEYTGSAIAPSVEFTYNDGGNDVTVTLIKDVDYTVKGCVDAGTHKTEIIFINPNYVADGDNTAEFTIAKKDLTITWRGNVNGKFEWTYDGAEHSPSVAAVTGVTITVIGGAVNAGTYYAYAYCDNGNYNIVNNELEYVIKPFEITVTWYGADGAEGTNFSREYDGATYFAPTATYVGLDGQTQNLTVLGARMYAGEYEATVVLPENCALKTPSEGTQKFEITKKVVSAIKWLNAEGTDGDLIWEYDGKVHAPTAIIDDGSNEALIVSGSAINAGVYTATANLSNPENYELKVSNATTEFTIKAKANVQINWYGKDDVLANDFVWDYDGELHAPRATFTDVNGKEVEIPVSGGATDAGDHTAKIVDVFDNYEFVALQTEQNFTVKYIDLTLEWTEGFTDNGDSYAYELTYNGKSQLPGVKSTSPADVNVTYYITDAADKSVNAIIDVGTYTVTAVASDGNYKIVSVSTITVEITPMTVDVSWGSLSLVHNGEEQAPKAWFTDANGQRVELAVTGGQTEVGTGYTATADFKLPSSNYVLGNGKTNTFDITEEVKHKYVWVWDEDGVTGSWKDLSATEPEVPSEPDNG